MLAFSSHVKQLREFFATGATRSLEYRISQLNALEKFLIECEAEIYAALYDDLKKPTIEAFTTEIGFTLTEIKTARKKLASWAKPKRIRTSLWALPGKSYIYSEPYGVTLIISPWNYPIQLSLVPLIGAIAAGNCAILKPSKISAATSNLLATRLPQYLDNNSIKIIEGGVPETTALLAEKFDYIFFTGSYAVGKIVMAGAANNLTPVTLELGGKNPCYVDENVDLDFVARRIATGKFYNAGQTCVAPDYILIKESIKAPFLAAMKKALDEFYGSDIKNNKDFARIISDIHVHRLSKLIQASGTPYLGGEVDVKEKYIAPTIFGQTTIDSPLMEEEIFGPILPIISIKIVSEAIDIINARWKPLALYLFSNDKKLQDQFINHTSSGAIAINVIGIQFISSLPAGGVGASGLGAYHGLASFETFSHRKSVLIKSTWFDTNIIYPPYTQNKLKWLKRIFLRKW
jgi:aldehyde dehydrogenase (NAD+)